VKGSEAPPEPPEAEPPPALEPEPAVEPFAPWVSLSVGSDVGVEQARRGQRFERRHPAIVAPTSAAALFVGGGYGLVNLIATGKIPNGAVLLILFAVTVLLVGLVSEQIASLRFEGPRSSDE